MWDKQVQQHAVILTVLMQVHSNSRFGDRAV